MLLTANSYDLKLNLTLTLLIVILFFIFNPFHALFFSALTNVVYKKIDYNIFSFIFAFSFALIFTNRAVGPGDDVSNYISLYRNDLDIINPSHIIEPLWVIYNKIQLFIFRDDIDSFVIFNYFIMFLLIIFISKSLNKKNYIIVSFFLLFFNLGILYAVFHLWRHSFALLIFFVGIYTIRASFFIFLAPLFHVAALPLTIATKWNYRNILPLLLITYILYIYMYDKINLYSNSKPPVKPYFSGNAVT